MTISWKIQTVKLKDIKKHPSNPRTISHEQVAHLTFSMDKFGLIDKPILNTDMVLIGGHQRIAILKKQGVKEVECQMPDRLLSEDEVKELMIRLNLNHGSFNYEILANEFEVPDLLDFGFSIEDLHLGDPEEIASESEESPKKKKSTCPSCGHEF